MRLYQVRCLCEWIKGHSYLVLILLLLIMILVFAELSLSVTGPAGDYSESNGDIIEICSDAACTNHTTSFNTGDTLYVRVTTDRVTINAGISRLRQRTYLNTNTGGISFWTMQPGGPPYVYTTSATVQNDASKVFGRIEDGTESLFFEEHIEVSGLNRPFEIFSDAARTDESYTFSPGAEMYITAYGSGATYSTSSTGYRNRLYDFERTSVKAWPAPTVSQTGNLYDFSLTVPSSGLSDGDWYWIRGFLRDSSSNTIMRDSHMIQIDGTPPVTAITAPAPSSYISGSQAIDGTADDTFSFYSYILEYGAGAAPTVWTQIGSTSYSPVTGGQLGLWDTTSVADGLYTIRLTATDRAYNTSTATVQVNVDNNAPVISSVQASGISADAATISWNTNEPADSQVEYGTSPGVYGSSTTLDPTMVTSHSQALSGLDQATTYYYRVRSEDPAGYTTYSSEYSFKTANIMMLQPFPGVSQDTYMRSNQPTWNLGADAYLGAGDIASGIYGTLRSTLRFNLSGIPAGAIINSATVSTYQWYQGSASTQTLDAHALTTSWVEGTGTGQATGDGATWLTTDGVNSWTTAGGDYNPVAAATTIAPDSTGSWVNWDITGLTQSWVDDGTGNYGVLVKQDVENPSTTDVKAFYSSNYAIDPARRPVLYIEWLGDDTLPPNVGEIRAENITRISADIKWSSDETATSQVEYGTTPSYGSTTPLDTTLTNQHTVNLSGLTEGTQYHYRVRSVDASGNETFSGDYIFTTAIQVVIQPDPADGLDTTICSQQPSWDFGAWSFLISGDLAGLGSMRSLLQFDLSDIPVGSAVNSATMSLYQWWQGSAGTVTLDAHSLSGNWTEGSGIASITGDGATWLTSDGVTPWTTAGGDYQATASASAVAPSGTGTWVDWNLTTLTQEWVSAATYNNGVIIKQDTENPLVTDAKAFYSSDYTGNSSLRPKLVIEYVPAEGMISLAVDETFNRDGSSGLGSVAFGSVNAGSTYYVGDTASPPYAVKLSLASNIKWKLEVFTSDDLIHSVNPSYTIDISNLGWRVDGSGAYQPFVKSPATDTILNDQLPTMGTFLMYDYEFGIPLSAISGSYSTSVIYSATGD